MSTPFELLRHHKKVLLAAVTGIAVLSFIITDTTSNSNQMSPVSVAAMVIGSLAVVGWIWGAKDGKSGENAILGAVLGLAITLVFMFMGRPAPVVYASTGNITKDNLDLRNRQRGLANMMVSRVFYANQMNQMLARFQPDRAQPPVFGFNSQNQTYDLLISELLNREADELGIQITDEAAMAYLKKAARSQFDRDEDKEPLTQEVFSEAIQQTVAGFQGGSKPNEDEIIGAIRYELRAQRAANILLGGNRMTPADVWEMHRKLNTRQSAQFVGLPVADFIDKSAQPTAAELAQTLDAYKGNFPNTSPEGKLEEGRPSLFLDRRVRLAYVEPVYEELEKLVGEITEEEIQARYEERYLKAMPELGPHGELNMPELPFLPNVPQAPAGTPDPAAPSTEKPADPAAPVGDKPAEPAAPETSEKPAGEAKPAEGEKPADPATPAEPKPEAATPEVKPEAPATPEKPAEPAVKPEGTSLRLRTSQLQPVVLIQDQPAAEAAKPVEAAPAAEAPAAEKPAAEVPAAEGEKPAAPPTEGGKPAVPAAEEKPAGDKPEEPAPPAGDKPAEETPAVAPLTVPAVEDAVEDPAPPVSKVRPLTDELKLEIRDEMMRDKMKVLMDEKANAARDFMNDLHLQVADYLDHQRALKDPKAEKTELSKDALSPKDATVKLQEYAKKNGLLYAETPLLTLEELLKSEDHPIGGAMSGKQSRVVDTLNKSQTEDLYSATFAFTFDSKGSYAFWKLEDVPAHQPKSVDEPGVKEMTTLVWRTLKARPLAEKRAKELADMISKSDKPIAETLSEQTVTGAQDKSLFVTVKSPGEFSWLQRSLAPQQFGGDNAPHLSAIDGVQGAGPTFMTKVFNDMKPGDTAVVPNEDLSVLYVTHIDKRSPATEVEAEVMRKQFLESQGDLTVYAMRQSGTHDGQFADRLFIKHGVKMSGSDEKSDK